MRSIIRSLCLAGAAAAAVWTTAVSAAPAARPNIVIILADDLGYGDVRCYNPERGRIPTPHIDRLAAEGMRFTDAHSSSGVCSPSRYTLLTGRYHWRTRLQRGIVEVFDAPLIAPDRLTVAELARRHGYHTACVGKWHLGWDWPATGEQRRYLRVREGAASQGEAVAAHRTVWADVFSKPIPGGPTARGFDEYFGTDVPNWPPYCFIENDRTLGIPTEFLPARLLGGTPMMASLPGPALKDWRLVAILPALTDRACAFIRSRAGHTDAPFLLYLALTTPHTPLAVNEPWRGASGLDNAAADLIMETDAAIGRVLDTLDATGAAASTLVLFTSDNGFAPYVGAAELEARGHYPSGPLRGYKGDAWEGGHRVPFIVRWPGGVEAGRVCEHLVHHADVIATVADILGTKLPDDAGEDSFSLLPLLKGGQSPVREHAVSCAGTGTPALRQGSWKLILGPPAWRAADKKGSKDSAASVWLFNLSDDIGERRNLAAEHPEKVREMQALLETLIRNGRSTPGAPQRNDVEVWRYPRRETATPAPAAKR